MYTFSPATVHVDSVADLTVHTLESFNAGTSTTYIYKEQLRTLGFFMSTIGGGIARTGAGAASGLIMTLPSIIIFIINQSRVQDTMAHSGIK